MISCGFDYAYDEPLGGECAAEAGLVCCDNLQSGISIPDSKYVIRVLLF